jgi:hypothetical protein
LLIFFLFFFKGVIILVESLPVHQPGGELPVEQAASTNGSDVADDI